MRRLLVILTVLVAMTCVGSADDGRKIVKKVAPVYPAMARQYQIAGAVKLEVTIAADGSVRNTKVIAGHPLLTGAAVEAVSHWHYEPGPETVGTVVINFSK
jgi:TonB family protein